MQATGTLRGARPSKGFLLAAVAMLCALVLGTAGGYAARGQSPATGGAAHVQQRVVDANQGSPQSDLTRVLPTAAPSADPAASYAIPDSGLIP